MGFFKPDTTSSYSTTGSPVLETADDWYEELVHGSSESGLYAVTRLIETGSEQHLLAALNSPRPDVKQSAAFGLIECWIAEQGVPARGQLEVGIEALDDFRYEDAEQMFLGLILAHPDWSEPRLQLAQLRYLEGRNLESIRLQREVLRLKSHHFGAWHGVALNAVELGRWPLARDAARAALAIRSDCKACRAILGQALSRLA